MKAAIKKVIYPLIGFFLLGFSSQDTIAQGTEMNAYDFGDGITFTGKSGYKMNLRGYVQPKMETRFYSSDSLSGSLSRFRLRRARLRLDGDALNKKIDYRLQIDLTGYGEDGEQAASYLLDAWVAYNFSNGIKITFGQRFSPTDNRELMMGSNTLQLVERSRVTSAFASIREFGLFVEGRYRVGSTYFKPVISITNGDGPNVFNKDRGGLKYGARLDFLPFGLFNHFGQFRQADLIRELTPKLVIGAAYSYNDGMSSRRGRESGAIIYLNDEGKETLPDYSKICMDLLFKYKGFSLIGEFVHTAATVPSDLTTRVRNDGTTSKTMEVDGKQDISNYVKGRMMLGNGYNIQAGYVFRSMWSIDARYTKLVADKNSFLNNGTFYNRPEYYTLGISKYMGRNYGFKIQGDLTYSTVNEGSNDIYGDPYAGHEIILGIITSFSF